jgi:NADPH:quinone reductase-like Zn-dependent oxidoreductase
MGHVRQARWCSPTVTEVFPFNAALKSFEHVMTGHARGKVMLDMTQ